MPAHVYPYENKDISFQCYLKILKWGTPKMWINRRLDKLWFTYTIGKI